jgi:GNAT superfamily N-acetyltransferase
VSLVVRPAQPADGTFIRRLLVERWYGTAVTSKRKLYNVTTLPCLVADVDGVPTGLVALAHAREETVVVLMEAGAPGRGIGKALFNAAIDAARAAGSRRLWLTTTNDNVRALKFYLREGMRLVAVDLGAADDARRRLKPAIPTHAPDGTAITDEWELEIAL